MQKISVELNFFYMHYNDAKSFAEWAKEHRNAEIHASIYGRHAIISAVFAAEALINRVLVEFGKDEHVAEILERASVTDKWYLAPLLCSSSAKPEPFNRGSEPFQSFKELVQIRNWFAHPKVDTFLPATLDPNSGIIDSRSDPSEEYPWLEMLKGDAWRQTKIPKNPFEIDHTHAKTSIEIVDAMTKSLSAKLDDQLTDNWLEQITVKDDAGLHRYKVPVFSIWGGYGGASESDG